MTKKLLDRVISLLETEVPLRDDVILTRRKIWQEDLFPLGKTLLSVSGDELLELERSESITKSESIRRMWQLAQQRHPHLRGENYDVRHGKAEPETKQEIKDLNKVITQEKREEKEETKNENSIVESQSTLF